MKRTKICIFIICSIIIISSSSPVLLSSAIYNKEILDTYETNQRENTAKIYFYEYCKNGDIKRQCKEIPLKDAIIFKNQLEQNDDTELSIMFDQLTDINNKLKKEPLSINKQVKTWNPIKNNIQHFNENKIFNLGCQLEFKMIGLGFCLGTHGIIPVGADILGGFIGLGSVDTSGGMLDDQHISGICFGGFVVFVGSLILALIPFFPGPYINAKGFAGLTFWL